MQFTKFLLSLTAAGLILLGLITLGASWKTASIAAVVVCLLVFVSMQYGLKTLLSNAGPGLLLVLAIWPGVLLFVAYLTDGLHTRLEMPPQIDALGGLLLIVAIGAPSMIISAIASFSMERKMHIVVNVTTSVLWAVALGIVLGYYRAQAGYLEYWTSGPFVFSLLEALIGLFTGIQNAWNKNPGIIRTQ